MKPLLMTFLLFIYLICFRCVSSCSPGWPRTYYTAQVNYKLMAILLPQLVNCQEEGDDNGEDEDAKGLAVCLPSLLIFLGKYREEVKS